MPLNSNLFTHDREIRIRLERCQVNDRDHIVLGDRGAHVECIQHALHLAMPELVLPDNELVNPVLNRRGTYGPKTAEAVAKYKRNHIPQILNHRNAIDSAVGRKTITFLDEDTYKKEHNGKTKRQIDEIIKRLNELRRKGKIPIG